MSNMPALAASPDTASATPSAASATANSADAQFEAIYTAEWQWRGKQFAANEDTSGTVAAHLPEVGEAAQQARLAYWRDVDKKLDGIDVGKLSHQRAVDYQVYRFQIETLIADQVYKTYQRPLSGDTSFWGDLADTARGTLHNEQEYRDYLNQISDIPRYFTENIDNMRAGLKRGFTLPQITLEGRDSSVKSVIDAPSPEDNIYYTPFKTMPATISPAKQAELRKQAVAVISGKIVPAYKTLLGFLQTEYVPGAQKSLAAYDLPDGKAFYRAQIREYTTLDTDPKAIHELGLE
ncbi:MAG: DUF885 family protein, partial [Rhizomicrobium sp.]